MKGEWLSAYCSCDHGFVCHIVSMIDAAIMHAVRVAVCPPIYSRSWLKASSVIVTATRSGTPPCLMKDNIL